MKYLTLIILIMSTLPTSAQNGVATTTKKTFSRETSVSIDISSDVSIIWTLLTNAADFPRWNSTVVSLDGEIEPGSRIRLKSTLDEKRVFKLKVKEMVPEQRLVWGDSKGDRTYTLSKIPEGVRFSMVEKIGGLMFPMYAKYIPPFDESFEKFAQDLKKEAEAISNTL